MDLSNTVRVGQEQITVRADDQKTLFKATSVMREMADRVPSGARMRVRNNNDEGYEYFEFYDPKMNAAKKVSSTKKSNRLHEDLQLEVYLKTPWIKFAYVDAFDEVLRFFMYDQLNKDLRKAGYRPNQWYIGDYDVDEEDLDKAYGEDTYGWPENGVSSQKLRKKLRDQYQD